MRDTTTIDNERTIKQQEVKEAETNNFKIAQEILLLQRDIINLQGKKKELEIAASKSGHILKIKRIELKSLENEYWNTRNA